MSKLFLYCNKRILCANLVTSTKQACNVSRVLTIVKLKSWALHKCWWPTCKEWIQCRCSLPSKGVSVLCQGTYQKQYIHIEPHLIQAFSSFFFHYMMELEVLPSVCLCARKVKTDLPHLQHHREICRLWTLLGKHVSIYRVQAMVLLFSHWISSNLESAASSILWKRPLGTTRQGTMFA